MRGCYISAGSRAKFKPGTLVQHKTTRERGHVVKTTMHVDDLVPEVEVTPLFTRNMAPLWIEDQDNFVEVQQ